MKKLSLLFFFVYISLCSHAKTDSVYIDVSTLKYASEFERTQFSQLDKKGTFNALHFLYCLDSTVTAEKAAQIEQKLNTFFDEKLSPLIGNKNTDKAIKAVFKQIHDNLLTKYVKESRFERLLDNGEYNCVTASALYALAFQKFGIPYQLRSTTDHVYVIANPGPNQLLIEATDPVGGAFSYNEQYKRTYIDMLVKQKMISKQENNETPLEQLFQKHFYTSDTIDLKQLIGYHYYNNGVALIGAQEFAPAANQLMKAYYLNRNSKVEHLLFLALAAQIGQNFDVTDTIHLQRYFMFCKLGKETDFDALYNSYAQASDELLVRKDDTQKFDEISQYLFRNLPDTGTVNKFKEHYYYALAVTFYTKKDFISAYENILKANCINSKNIRIKAVYDELSKNLFRFLVEEAEDEKDMDSLINRIALAENCGGGLSDQWRFQMMMIQAGIKFEDKDLTGGNSLLAQAEKFAADKKMTDLDDLYASLGYSAAQTYYYIRYDVAKAKEYVLRGLKLDPDNRILKSNLESLNRTGTYQRPQYSNAFPPPPPPPMYKTETKPTAPRTVIVKTPK
ncbi:MAG TPA: hypothetical protein VK174_03430 [Chitinophagales bacterium]|nr:hypothetical protein [Chitinophagales bacterium]